MTHKLLAMGVGTAALCATALPAAAISFTVPGGTMGVPAGANPPPGLYFVNAFNDGVSGTTPTTSVGIQTPIFLWAPGWNFLGASYAAAVGFPLVDIGVHNITYLRGVFNPFVNPLTLSWNLGNGFFASFGEYAYVPIKSEIANDSAPTTVTSGASFEQRFSLSYLANDWVLSANNIIGITTADTAGIREPDYYDINLTAAREFGKWEIGVVGYGSFDINTTPINAVGGKGVAIGAGGLLGYNFGPVDLVLELTHQFSTHGADPGLPNEDTRVWTTVSIPIWNPAPAPHAVVAKY